MPDENKDDPAFGRRGFFNQTLRGLLRPLADQIEKRLPAGIDLPVLSGPRLIRPPGAIPEEKFLETCLRCGRCADACPADAIELMSNAPQPRRGTPRVEPSKQACVICDELACMKVCPSGALQLVDRLQIRMGLAIVNHALCVRTLGQDCRECIDKCPLGPIAIRLDSGGRVEVIEPSPSSPGCTGCGVCEQYCPTTPAKAIVIT